MTFNFVDITAIKIKPNRQRLEFREGELNELKTSIENNQLLHPIVLRCEGNDYTLVAGERRLRAIQDIYDLGGHFRFGGQIVVKGLVPFVSMGELSPLEAMEAEYEENIRRTDLTWQEKAIASSNLMELRRKQAEVAGLPPPSVADLAVEVRGSAVGYPHTATKKELILARHLDDPQVNQAKTADEAYKLLQRKEVAAANARLGEEVGKTFTSSVHQVYNMSAEAYTINCAPNSFDVILTDPPYGMGADEFGDSGGAAAGGHFYEDSPAILSTIMEWLPSESYRTAKPEAHLYVFCDIDYFVSMKLAFTLAGWEVFRTPLIWNKPAAFRAPWPEMGPQRKYETILYAVKGKKKVTRLYGDVLTYQPDKNLGHPAQKPVGLYSDLLLRSVKPGDTVADFFCGTGPIFPAAHELKCRAIGIELDQAAFGVAVQRIKELK